MNDTQENQSSNKNQIETYLGEISKLNNELINMQRELSASNAALAKALEFKNRFIGMVVHDLRNPLTIISMYTQTIKSKIDEPKLIEECITIIEHSADFMAELIESLLDTTSLESGSFSITFYKNNITELIKNTLKQMQPIAQNRSIHIHEQLSEIEPFYFDAFRIEQVITNIISNALKYTPTDGNVYISVKDNSETVVIVVKDTGIGIPEEEQHKTFTFFGRTTNQSPHGDKSVGLGLAVCKHIIEAHDGTIELTSKASEGTTITILLPKLPRRAMDLADK
ncbi:MAG TPA: HAMP domain-containing sensor histidine kinase [Spirochaetia bacterium]|nr:HAMP domain-containing sensor histidine kinase [Spirochaetales bacterium]HRS65067.1 HAMP domain-containing sensor histidine kinase [Spirochaetia bacterium]HOT59104.1 HAMP domain-containing sensor histidine kinase [Spirochaetales bacterium]HPD80414.1 HAMP domain-containing sensor histidine kinase [Spirochaetales bacterium]HQG39276.1 HAMP domain-containing sensor histidine kinase [Spirochaetales bacterium]